MPPNQSSFVTRAFRYDLPSIIRTLIKVRLHEFLSQKTSGIDIPMQSASFDDYKTSQYIRKHFASLLSLSCTCIDTHAQFSRYEKSFPRLHYHNSYPSYSYSAETHNSVRSSETQNMHTVLPYLNGRCTPRR